MTMNNAEWFAHGLALPQLPLIESTWWVFLQMGDDNEACDETRPRAALLLLELGQVP